jgi:RHS repeat-associated protein
MSETRKFGLLVLSAPFILAGLPLLAGTGQPDETLPGFKSRQVYQAGGLDHVNLFSGDVGIVIPLGPEYPLSPGLAWQLRATYSSKIWTFDTVALPGGGESRFAYISGYPTLGVGWSLHAGYVDDQYWISPGTGRHVFPSASGISVSKDGSGLRRTGDITSGYTIELPDGTRHIFGKKFFRPRPSPEERPPTQDFSDDVYGADRPSWGLTAISDRFGKRVLVIDYLDALTGLPADAWKIWRIHLTPPPDFAGVERVIVWNWGTWTNLLGATWPVLNSVDFPSANGTLTVRFDRNADLLLSSFTRNSFDTAHLPDGNVPGYVPTNGTVYPPQLTSIRMTGADGQGGSGELARYVFQYNGTLTDKNVANGTLREFTLPTGGRVSYTYSLTSGGGLLSDDLESAGCPAGGSQLPTTDELVSSDPEQRFRRFLDKSAAVATRTESVPGLPDSVTNYCRRLSAPMLPTLVRNLSHIVRQVVVTRPDGNGGTIATKHLFTVEAIHNDGDPSNAGLELVRRYYPGADVTGAPIRSLVFCYDSDDPANPTGPPLHGCGYKDPDGSLASFVGVFNIRLQNEATWYGVNPTGGGNCSQAGPSCRQRTFLGWNATALEFATERISSNTTFLLYDDTGDTTTTGRYRDHTTTWQPSVDATHWLLKLFSSKNVTDHFLTGACLNPPCSITTSYGFNSANGFLNSVSTTDGAYGTLTHAFTPDAAGNPALETVVGSWSGAGSYVTRRTFLHGLPLTSSRDALPVPWNGFDVTRDLATGLISTSRDPNGLSTSYLFDALGRLTRVVPPGETATTYCYRPWNSATGQAAYVLAKRGGASACSTNDGAPAEGSGSFEAYLFDGDGRVRREFRRAPNALAGGAWFSFRETRYDTAGHLSLAGEWAPCPAGTDVASCFGATASAGTSFANFDFLDRARTITSPDGNLTTKSFDNGTALPNSDYTEFTTVFNVGGQAAYSGMRKDILGRTLIVADPGPPPFGPYACYSYNTLDKLVSVNSLCGNLQSRSFTYDRFGFLRSETHPEKGTKSYLEYDALGNVKKAREGGFNYRYAYDALGRLLTVRADTLASPSDEPTTVYVENAWDGVAGPTGGYPKGRLTQQIGRNPATSDRFSVWENFTYAGLGGRLSLHETTMKNAALQNVLVAAETYGYNSLGLLESHGHPRTSGSFVTTTTYASGRPVRVSAAGSPVVSLATHNPAGGLAGYTTGNGVTTTIDPDPSGMPRPRQISSSGASQNWSTGAFSYDGAGNITRMGSDTFGYDLRSRLTSATFGSVTGVPRENFVYDDLGNMTQRDWSGAGAGTVSQTTSTSTNRLTAASYDTLGNISAYGSDRFTHDALSRRWRYSTSGTLEEYAYDGSGERLARKAVVSWRTSYYATLRDEENRVRTDYRFDPGSGATTLLKDYVYLGNLLMATYTTTATSGQPLGWAYYSNDHLGSPRLLTNPSRTALATYRYRAFGLPMNASVTPGQGTDFASMEKDAASGHHYDHARFYGNWFARFNSPDKLSGHVGDPQSWNRYTYARNNPLKYVDPDGHLWRPPKAVSETASVAFSFIPVAGDVQDAIRATTGFDPITAESLSTTDRVISGVAVLIPFVGGAVLSKAIGRGVESEARVLRDIGEIKNTEKVVGAEGKSIPDFMNATKVGDIKDAKRVTDSPQLRIQREAAKDTSREHVLITGDKTKVSGTVEKNSTVIRRTDLGPE